LTGFYSFKGRITMAEKTIIATDKAPAAIGTYSQAVKVGSTVYLSGQIPLDPATMALVGDDFEAQTVQVFENLKAVCEAAGGSFDDIAKLNIFLTDLSNFAKVNELMGRYFNEPYPARAAIGVKELPRGSQVEMDGVMEL
jgi:reactive intermediate/imine deaminase